MKPPVAAQLKLRLSDLFWWVLGSALILYLYQLHTTTRTPFGERPVLFNVIAGTDALIHGAALAIIVRWIELRWRSVPFPREPGHWILLLRGLLTPVVWLPNLMSIYWPASWQLALGLSAATVWVALSIVENLICAGCALLPAYYLRTGRAWNVLFAVSVANCEVQLTLLVFAGPEMYPPRNLFHVLSYNLHLVASLTATVVVLTAIILDRRAGRRRDDLHWLGVGVSLAGSALVCLWYWWVVAFLRV